MLDHLADELTQLGYCVGDVFNFDTSAIILFKQSVNDCVVDGELRVNRIDRQFEISAKCGDETILPVFGMWDTIDKYLRNILTLC